MKRDQVKVQEGRAVAIPYAPLYRHKLQSVVDREAEVAGVLSSCFDRMVVEVAKTFVSFIELVEVQAQVSSSQEAYIQLNMRNHQELTRYRPRTGSTTRARSRRTYKLLTNCTSQLHNHSHPPPHSMSKSKRKTSPYSLPYPHLTSSDQPPPQLVLGPTEASDPLTRSASTISSLMNQ